MATMRWAMEKCRRYLQSSSRGAMSGTSRKRKRRRSRSMDLLISPPSMRLSRGARRTIWIVGWDFNLDICLRPRVSSETLGELLLRLTDDAPELQVRSLSGGWVLSIRGRS